MLRADFLAKQTTTMSDLRRSHLVRLLRDERGSLLPVFAIILLVLIGMIGMGIDYTRASFANAKLQVALDATALALSANASTITSGALTSEANTLFSSIYTGTRLTTPSITATYSNAGGPQIVLTGTATLPTTFLNLPPFRLASMNLSASSTIAWGQSRLRVALVLDNTGSMSDSGKIGALQTATKNLLNQLKSVAVNTGDVYVSIIPFVKDVNVGSSYSSASWIDWTDWEANNGSCSRGNATTKSSCTNNGYTWTPDSHSTWNGCITDRGNSNAPSSQNYDENVNAPTAGVNASLFPAEQYDSCPLQMKGLSYDWTAMTTMVNQMTPNGNTNQAIGLVWGWMSLVGGGPLDRSGDGLELPVSAGHHPADRRPQHAGSLVQQRVIDQHAPAGHLRQCQGSWHHTLHRPGQHRWRSDLDPAAELRERLEQVLPVDVGERDHHHVPGHRQRNLEAAHREVAGAALAGRSSHRTANGCWYGRPSGTPPSTTPAGRS